MRYFKENGITPVALASTADDAWLVSQYIQQLSDGIKGKEFYDSLRDGTGKWNDEAMVEAGKLFQKKLKKDILKTDLLCIERRSTVTICKWTDSYVFQWFLGSF